MLNLNSTAILSIDTCDSSNPNRELYPNEYHPVSFRPISMASEY
ncbi:hypothetical protein DSUL_60276 [Desulfovibrionales bacterium]